MPSTVHRWFPRGERGAHSGSFKLSRASHYTLSRQSAKDCNRWTGIPRSLIIGLGPGRRLEMIDSLTKKSANGKTVTFRIEGDRKSDFVYSSGMDGPDIKEINDSLKVL